MNDLFADDLQQIHLASPTDLAGFRRAARRLLASSTPPDQVMWHSSGAEAAPDAPESAAAPAIHVAPDFLALCETVILHSDVARFELLYRLLWRMAREPGLKHDPLDADRLKAQHLAQAVRRDMHKMKAFVRFRTVLDETFRALPTGGPLHVAWFEPEHHIVEAIAPFFARRFTQMRWVILTPQRCLAWDGARMRFSPGAPKSDAPPPDAGEALWLTYYQNIFNPARLKLRMMQKEMPRRYWHNLPEAHLISTLASDSGLRQQKMVDQAPSTPHRRIPAFKRMAESQQTLQI
jgi:DNA polymerase